MPGCQERDERIAALERRVAELEARLATNATNSGLPPSANPPGAPKPVAKKPTGQKPGGQPGHAAHLRQRWPPERVNQVVTFVPDRCTRCQEPLPPHPGLDDPEPTWHQVAELPQAAAHVTEYQGHFCTRPCCGQVNHAPIPQGFKKHSIGPRLAATLGYLAGSHHVSGRGLEEIAEDVFDVPVALGTVANLESQLSKALAPAHAGARAAVRAAEVKNVDETGWKQAGQKRWLWPSPPATGAVLLTHARRSFRAPKALLGTDVIGWLISDRRAVYDKWPPLRRQLCWAHLKRDFRKLADRGGPAARLGRQLLGVARRVFEEWHLFRGGTISRAALGRRMGPLAYALERLLQAGRRCADRKAAGFCANLYELLPAAWQFVVTEGLEPTNNHAERLLPRGVLWRKNAFGSHSEGGCRFVGRILTVVQTRRLQGRSVLRYLYQAVVAHRQGLPSPSLLSAE